MKDGFKTHGLHLYLNQGPRSHTYRSRWPQGEDGGFTEEGRTSRQERGLTWDAKEAWVTSEPGSYEDVERPCPVNCITPGSVSQQMRTREGLNIGFWGSG